MKRNYEIPNDLYYTKTHEWLRIEGDIGIIGITDYAQDMLHDIVYVDLPEIGRRVKAGEAFMELESVKSVAEVYAPVSGNIIDVNESLIDSPELINKSPYGDGWLVKIRIANLSEVKNLLTAEEYRKLIKNMEHK